MTLLNDLLDLSKLEAGKIVYSMAEGNLAEIVDSVNNEMRAYAEEKGRRRPNVDHQHLSFGGRGSAVSLGVLRCA